jgi:small-conductance mechanosensitive channel
VVALRILPADLPYGDQQVLSTAGQLLGSAVAFVAILVLARLLRRLVRRTLGRRRVRADMALLAERTVYLGSLALAVYVLVTLALGNVLGAALGVIAAAVVTSLGLQDLLKSYVAGFYVLMERNIQVGRLVRVDSVEGVVTNVGMRTTFLRAQNGGTIVIPNAELFGKTVSVEPAPEGWGEAPPPSPLAGEGRGGGGLSPTRSRPG